MNGNPAFRKTLDKMWEYRVLYLFLLPGVACFLIFNYTPMLGLVMIFQHYDPVSGFLHSQWVGLENFRRIFSSPVFGRAMRNTIVISALKLAITFPLPVIFALLLNELRRLRFKKVVQTISYLPNFVSWVIVAGIFYVMLSSDGGVVNELLLALGIIQEPVSFMASKGWFYPIIIVSDVWKNLGFNTIFYLAALASIDPQLYEAATVDGAGRFRQALHITLPGMRSTIVLLLILAISGLLNAGFDQLWTMGNMAVRDIGDILDTAVLRTLTSGTIEDLSVGATMGFFKSFIGLVLFIAANRFSKAMHQDSII
jgi:putative aldouronate transport system permease protein